MGSISPSNPVKVIAGFIFSDPGVFEKASYQLTKRLGSIDLESGLLIFNHTFYYNNEMGTGLKRKFLSFKKLKSPEDIYKLKLLTSKIEKAFTVSGKRKINIDPGYITPGKLILLTSKNYAHRVYLKRGIYADATLVFKDKSYRGHETTYPDYRTKEYRGFFNRARGIYLKSL